MMAFLAHRGCLERWGFLAHRVLQAHLEKLEGKVLREVMVILVRKERMVAQVCLDRWVDLVRQDFLVILGLMACLGNQAALDFLENRACRVSLVCQVLREEKDSLEQMDL